MHNAQYNTALRKNPARFAAKTAPRCDGALWAYEEGIYASAFGWRLRRKNSTPTVRAAPISRQTIQLCRKPAIR